MVRVTLDWVQLVIVVAAFQGLFLSAVLVTQRQNRTANRLLAALVLTFSVYLASSVYYSAGLINEFPHFFGVSYPTTWLFGPLVYLYAVAASDRAWHLTKRELLHFAPAAVAMILAVPYLLQSGAGKIATLARFMSEGEPTPLAVMDPTKYASGIGYSIATVLHLRTHRRRVQDSYSNMTHVSLRWLMLLVGAACATWALATVLRVSDFSERLREEHISLAIALIVYAIGYIGLKQPEVFRHDTAEFPVAVTRHPEPVTEPAASRYERSGMTAADAERLTSSLTTVMDKEQLWKDSELTLSDLARRLDTSPHKLSEVLNAQVGATFYDFVNGYRVREVQRRIQAGDARSLKMLALAMDAGFASKSTFNDAFKKHTNLTPSGYRQTVGA